MPYNSSEILEMKDLMIGYGKNNLDSVLLNSINLGLRRGELTALIGENGSGKSTLLRSICGLQPFLSGRILIDKEDIREISINERAMKIAFVSTDLVGVNNLRVYDLVALGRFPYTDWFGVLKDIDREIVNKSLSKVGIEDLSGNLFSELSDGQKQRVMIARALAQDTDIIILDEPTAFLDLPNKYEIISLLRDIAWKENKAIVFSVHDINIAIREADKLWVIYEKQIINGSPEDLIIRGIMKDLFKGRNVTFDGESGEITRQGTKSDPICVYGFGIEKIWTIRALERLNFEVDCNKSNDNYVKISRQEDKLIWESSVDGNFATHNSIYDLTLFLRKLKPELWITL